VESSTGDDVSEESKLGDTSMLELNVTETVETVLVSIIKKSKGIEESKRSLNSELGLECVESSGGLSNLGRCESSSRCDEGSEDKFHFVGLLELFVMKDITGGEFPGDFRNEALDFGWDTFDEETKLSKRGIELNNGRAAQLGILGLMVHEQLGGVLPIVGEM